VHFRAYANIERPLKRCFRGSALFFAGCQIVFDSLFKRFPEGKDIFALIAYQIPYTYQFSVKDFVFITIMNGSIIIFVFHHIALIG